MFDVGGMITISPVCISIVCVSIRCPHLPQSVNNFQKIVLMGNIQILRHIVELYIAILQYGSARGASRLQFG